MKFIICTQCMVKVGKMKKKRKICIYRRVEGLTTLARLLALYYGHRALVARISASSRGAAVNQYSYHITSTEIDLDF